MVLEKFSRLEAQGLAKEGKLSEVSKKLEEKKNKRILFITHFNVFMYAACFFMQSGTLPVSITICDLFILQIIKIHFFSILQKSWELTPLHSELFKLPFQVII